MLDKVDSLLEGYAGTVGGREASRLKPKIVEALKRYEFEDSYPVKADVEKIRDMGVKVFATDLLGVTDYVRHDSLKMNKALIKLIATHRVIKR